MGYETGIGSGESIYYPDYMRRQTKVAKQARPDEPKPRRGSAFIYLSTFGRSVRRAIGAVLLEDPVTLGQLVCTSSVQCCPDGAEAMTKQWREHSVRSRSRELQTLADMPMGSAWRLKMISDDASRAAVAAASANEVLADKGIRMRLPVTTFVDLHNAVDTMRHSRDHDVA